MMLHSLSLKSTRRGATFLSFLLVLVMVLSACGNASSPTANTKQGGTLTIVASVSGNYTRNFDISAPGSVLVGTQGFIYETLLYFKWGNPQMDQLLSQYESTTDQATQKQIVAQFENTRVQQLSALPMLYSATWYEYSTACFVGWPDASNPYANPASFTAPDNEQSCSLSISHKARVF